LEDHPKSLGPMKADQQEEITLIQPKKGGAQEPMSVDNT
jgi:hypothetical protein